MADAVVAPAVCAGDGQVALRRRNSRECPSRYTNALNLCAVLSPRDDYVPTVLERLRRARKKSMQDLFVDFPEPTRGQYLEIARPGKIYFDHVLDSPRRWRQHN
jgi:hypothetical protein